MNIKQLARVKLLTFVNLYYQFIDIKTVTKRYPTALYSDNVELFEDLSIQNVQAVCSGTPDDSSWLNLLSVCDGILLGEKDIMGEDPGFGAEDPGFPYP